MGSHGNGLPTSSRMARITVNQSASREAVRVALAATGLSQKAMAINAGAMESHLSDALNGRGRNLEIDWILAQDDAFILAFWQSVEQQRGLTAEARKAARAESIVELLRQILEVA